MKSFRSVSVYDVIRLVKSDIYELIVQTRAPENAIFVYSSPLLMRSMQQVDKRVPNAGGRR